MSDDYLKIATSRITPIAAAARDALDNGASLEAVIAGGLLAAYNEGTRAATSELLAQLIEQGFEPTPFDRAWPDSLEMFQDVVERHSH